MATEQHLIVQVLDFMDLRLGELFMYRGYPEFTFKKLSDNYLRPNAVCLENRRQVPFGPDSIVIPLGEH